MRNRVVVNETPNQVIVNETPVEVVVSLVGQQGVRGGTLIFGEISPPSQSLGQLGDLYIDTVKKEVWGPKLIDLGINAEYWPEQPSFTFGAASRHVHVQGLPSNSWIIYHALGGKPSVMVVDSAETVVIGEVTYVSGNEVRVDFSAPFSGSAFLT